jgi:hypothetical protein
MAIELTMPALSPTMEKGTLAKWLVSVGDSIKPGDLLAEIETDKATMEYEAIDEGDCFDPVILRRQPDDVPSAPCSRRSPTPTRRVATAPAMETTEAT